MSDPEEICDDPAVIFESARHLGVAERVAYLDRVCKGNPFLRENIESMIDAHANQGEFLADPTVDVSPGEMESLGSMIGPYKLLQKIGEGGMGMVYMAEQTNPIKMRVALKIIKPGMDSKQVIARFENERQTLAIMEHPNIAKVLAAGTTDSGHPYFAMELVKGERITTYCDKHCLTLRERLRLFLSVCSAVQHAHQKGIIHRDLKPSNVLVARYDGSAVPKVIDFGVAKATGHQLTDKTLFTRYGQIVGTLEYMSPEQVEFNQVDVDTRSDIYSLGILFYELLTGTTPFDPERLRSGAWDEVVRIIREEEPPRPSVRISTDQGEPQVAAQQRGVEPGRFLASLRGELDWLAMKALAKERDRRYATASAFADDIQRYLNGEAIEARPPSAVYRLRKTARRHRFALATTTTAIIALLGITGISVWSAVRIAQESERVKAARDQAVAALDKAEEATRIAEWERQKAQNILFDKVLMYALSGDVELTKMALADAADVKLSEAQQEFAIAIAHTWNGDQDEARLHYDIARKLGGDSYAIQASEIQVMRSDRHFYEKILKLRESRPTDPFDYIFEVQAEAWHTPGNALEALEKCGEWRDSTLALYFGALARANHALFVYDLKEAESSIQDLKKLLMWYPCNKLPLCGTLYTSLCARSIAIHEGELTQAATHEQAARQAVEALAAVEHDDVFWVTRSRAWFFAECGEGSLALTEWKKRMGREPLGIDPMHYAACCCLFGDQSDRTEAVHALPDAFDVQNAHAHLAKAYLLALSDATDEEVGKACDSLFQLQDPRREMNCGIVEVWLARGDLARAQLTAKELMKVKSPKESEHWDVFLQFIVSEEDDSEFIRRFEGMNPPMFQAKAEYLAGLKALAEGRGEQASTYFSECRNSGRVFASWYWWSKVFLQRLGEQL